MLLRYLGDQLVHFNEWLFGLFIYLFIKYQFIYFPSHVLIHLRGTLSNWWCDLVHICQIIDISHEGAAPWEHIIYILETF